MSKALGAIQLSLLNNVLREDKRHLKERQGGHDLEGVAEEGDRSTMKATVKAKLRGRGLVAGASQGIESRFVGTAMRKVILERLSKVKRQTRRAFGECSSNKGNLRRRRYSDSNR
ncbi:hypothetical protein CRG98_012717 [Punica granatum]|uniref:Uncharacterized protein n=1 Tax=Punica granatum TaxID=22663 RepID=A0A2I0KEB3_PUNGR|nr:hypothetical protein CRG98_012717 [Punica granatum]